MRRKKTIKAIRTVRLVAPLAVTPPQEAEVGRAMDQVARIEADPAFYDAPAPDLSAADDKHILGTVLTRLSKSTTGVAYGRIPKVKRDHGGKHTKT